MGTLENNRLRVAINAQLEPGRGSGGVESALIGLIHALGRLDGPEEYVVIGPWPNPDWLRLFMGRNQTLVTGPPPFVEKKRNPIVKSFRRFLAPTGTLIRKALEGERRTSSLWPEIPISDGFYENLKCEVIHFPYQYFVLCSLPSIFNPHDLQHRHYPQFFNPSYLAWRESTYRGGCQLSHRIAVGSRWVKEDIIDEYNISPAKIQIIPWAPPTVAYPDPSTETMKSVERKYGLIPPFAFYPAVTWPHKNHKRLLLALVQIRDIEGFVVRLVCTGYQHPPHWLEIEQLVISLNLQSQVHFLGIVSPEELRAIYRLSQFVIVPSLFEAASGPVFEAWQEGVPVACAEVTSLPEQAGDAALLFDPLSVQSIARVIKRMSNESDLRNDLIERGKKRLADFSWDRTARAYRALYRLVAGRQLEEEDRFLLNWDWMAEASSRIVS